MTQRFILAVFLVLVSVLPGRAQTAPVSDDYYTLVSDMMVMYGNQQYDNALNTFKKVLAFKEQCNATDYYYGAACAAITHRQALAFTYLRESVKKGWLDTLRIQENSDFDTVRLAKEWKPLMQDIKARYQKLLEVFKGVKGKELENLVPYTNENNWGWMDKRTGKAVTVAFFEETGFAEKRGLAFKYKDMDYHYLNNQIVVTKPESLSEVDSAAVTPPSIEGELSIEAASGVSAELAHQYVAVKTTRGWNILNTLTGKQVGKRDYQSIKRIAGNIYFLVTTTARTFYIDENGKEYFVTP